jgi:cobalt-zinc-cadmium efflux system membrane fusion protein
VLTSRAAGTVSRIFKRIGDPIRAGETLALVESRDASAIAADQSAASARVTLAARQLARERSLLAQGVSPRADYETAEANLAVARADAMRASAAAGATRVARDGRSVVVASPVSGRVTAAPANLGQFVSAETELFQSGRSQPSPDHGEPAVHGRCAACPCGDRVELSLADGQIIEGRVRSSTGVVDPDRAVRRWSSNQYRRVDAGTSQLRDPHLRQRWRRQGWRDGAARTRSRPSATERSCSSHGERLQGDQCGGRQPQRRTGCNRIWAEAGTPIATINAFLLKAELEKESAE